MGRFRDKTVVIVGGSSGIGRATAHAFARRGARLVLAARGLPALDATAAECRQLGAEVLVVPTDVSVPVQVELLADAAVRRFGRIDVWVGAASVFSYGTVEDTPPDVFRQVLETNVHGQVHSVRAALAQFRRQGRGTLVLVGSLFSKVTSPYLGAYVMSKHATLALAKVLRQELRATPRIRVAAVLPASIDTPIYQHAANYTGRTPHPLPPVVAAERVAKAIVRTARKPRQEVVVGRVQGLSIPFDAIAPEAYASGSAAAMATVGLRPGRTDDTAGTIFAPADDAGAVSGGWRKGRVRRALTVVALGAGTALIWRAARPAR